VALFAIGDLQGCHAEFMALLERLRFDAARDRLWLTGDLVNRGPNSLAVLREVKALGDAATVVLGNHDLHLLALAFAPKTVRKREPELRAVLDAPDAAELLEWLAARPLLHREPGVGWTLIHAGLPPQWTLAEAERCAREVEQAIRSDSAGLLESMYGDEPDRWSPALKGAARNRFTINCLTRLRFVDREGRLALAFKGRIADAPAGTVPWFRHPGRATRADPLVFGHWSALGYLAEPGLRCLDTGCVWGGALTALRLDGDEAPVSLRCRGSARMSG
jgi:bis(5'-nucleosyl)-tetraphosphatase (symmetrical)